MAQSNRRQLLVDSPLQLQMVFFVLVLVAVSQFLLWFSVIHGLDEAAAAEPRKFFYDMGWIHNAIRAPMIIASCLSLLAAGLVTLFWSHRFAGPLRVISAAMARLKEGDFSVAPRVRQNDTHRDLVGEMAQMQESLRAIVEKDRKTALDAAKKLEKCLEVSSSQNLDLQAVVDQLKSIGADYRL